MTVYPWQIERWRELQHRIHTGNLPHAMLFVGAQGCGKADFARQLAFSLLCNNPNDEGVACGQCQACGLLAAGTHPDLRIVEPEEEGKGILIDTIRAVGDFLTLKGQYGRRQIVIINPAEAMNRLAANSLLKTLEEPTPDALIILVSSKPFLLLPTIRSRCQQVVFPNPGAEQAARWLEQQIGTDVDGNALLALGNGAPLEARRLHETGGLELRKRLVDQWLKVAAGQGDPLACAANWADLGLSRALHWQSSWTMDLIRLKSGANQDAITNNDLGPQLQKLATGLDLRRLFNQLEQITEYTRWAGGQLNAQLAMEDLMISWGKMCIVNRASGVRG